MMPSDLAAARPRTRRRAAPRSHPARCSLAELAAATRRRRSCGPARRSRRAAAATSDSSRSTVARRCGSASTSPRRGGRCSPAAVAHATSAKRALDPPEVRRAAREQQHADDEPRSTIAAHGAGALTEHHGAEAGDHADERVQRVERPHTLGHLPTDVDDRSRRTAATGGRTGRRSGRRGTARRGRRARSRSRSPRATSSPPAAAAAATVRNARHDPERKHVTTNRRPVAIARSTRPAPIGASGIRSRGK